MRDVIKRCCVIVVAMLMVGCSSSSKLSLTQDSVEIELGEALPDVKAYVDVSKLDKEEDVNEISFTLDKGDNLTVGEHEGTIQYGDEKKKFTIKVKDTTAPKLSIAQVNILEGESTELKQAITVDELSDYSIDINDSEVDYSKEGTYEAKAVVQDASENKSEGIIPVHVTKVKLSLSDASGTLHKGESLQLSAETNSKADVVYASSNEAVAKVDQTGKVTAVSNGTAKISAKVNSKETSCDIVVESEPVYTPPVQQSAPQASDDVSYVVYITKTGEKYHRSGCQYLKKSKIEIDKVSAISQGYTPCSKCHP